MIGSQQVKDGEGSIYLPFRTGGNTNTQSKATHVLSTGPVGEGRVFGSGDLVQKAVAQVLIGIFCGEDNVSWHEVASGGFDNQ